MSLLSTGPSLGQRLDDALFGLPSRVGSWLGLTDEVGDGRRNREEDVAKVQCALGQLGRLKRAPTGLIDRDTDDAVRKVQRENGLKADGWLRPGGPTEQTIGRLLTPKLRPKTREEVSPTLGLLAKKDGARRLGSLFGGLQDEVGDGRRNDAEDVTRLKTGLSLAGLLD